MSAIMQGDQYKIGFRFKKNDEYLTDEGITDMRIMIGSVIKSYGDNQITYNDTWWYYPITEEETFALPEGKSKIQARIEFASGDVIGKQLGKIKVITSRDTEVMIDE